MKESAISAEPRINDRIRVPEVRLVGPNGEQVGIVRVEDALRLAAEADLDLVEVAPQATGHQARGAGVGRGRQLRPQLARQHLGDAAGEDEALEEHGGEHDARPGPGEEAGVAAGELRRPRGGGRARPGSS